MNASEILTGAARKVEAGWTQGAYSRDEIGPDGKRGPVKYCALGAIRYSKAEAVPGAFSKSIERVCDVIQAEYPDFEMREQPDFEILARWNDARERTQAEVVAVLAKAAAL